MLTEEQVLAPQLTFDINRDPAKLRKLAQKYNIWVGGSTWTYQGWLQQVYFNNYGGPRSAFIESKFTQTSIAEASLRFPHFGNDSSFYNYPTKKQLDFWKEVLPNDFRMSFKVQKDITQRIYDWKHPRKGQPSEEFLNPKVFYERMVTPIANALGDRVGVFMLEFSPFHFDRQSNYTRLDFVKGLHNFLNGLPKSEHRYAVEVRDPELIDQEWSRLIDCLEYNGVAYCISQQTLMPSLREQLGMNRVFTTDFVSSRALVRPGTGHEEAVHEFEPYDRIQRPDPELRLGLYELIDRCIKNNLPLFLAINNRTEGNMPSTVAILLNLLETYMGLSLTD
jgi:uncharacterized protein YecE (DUF72 family)